MIVKEIFKGYFKLITRFKALNNTLYKNYQIFNILKEKQLETQKEINYFHLIKEANQIREKSESHIFSPNKVSHIILEDNADIDPAVRGKAFLREAAKIPGGKDIYREATEQEVLQANIFAFGGIDFDTPRHLSALLKAVNKLASFTSFEAEFEDKNDYYPGGGNYSAIAIFPEATRQERYDAAIKYSEDPFYYPPYIKDRVHKYIMPKILENNNDVAQIDIPKTISLFSFSVGGREVMMMENALKDIVRTEEKVTDEELYILLGNFRAVCLGYAFDPLHIQEMSFIKLIIFSEDDSGVLVPKDLEDRFMIHLADIIGNKSYHVFDLGLPEKSYGNYLVTINTNAVPKPKIEDFDHTIPYYLKAIEILPVELRGEIADFLCYDQVIDASGEIKSVDSDVL